MNQAEVTNRFSISWRSVCAHGLKKHGFFVYVANTGAPGDKLTNSLSYYGKFGGSIEKREANTMAAPHRDAIAIFHVLTFPFPLVDPPSFDDSIIANRERGEIFFFFPFFSIFLFSFFLFFYSTIRYIALFRKKTSEQVVEF